MFNGISTTRLEARWLRAAQKLIMYGTVEEMSFQTKGTHTKLVNKHGKGTV